MYPAQQLIGLLFKISHFPVDVFDALSNVIFAWGQRFTELALLMTCAAPERDVAALGLDAGVPLPQ